MTERVRPPPRVILEDTTNTIVGMRDAADVPVTLGVGTLPAAVQGLVSGAGTSFDVTTASDLGDSYRENGYFFDVGTGVLVWNNSRGTTPILNSILGAPWRKTIPRCKTNTTSTQWIASDPGVMTYGGLVQALTDDSFDVLVSFPTNDVNNSVASATTIANLTTIYDAIRAAGKRPWPTLGGIVSGWSAAQYLLADAINTACLTYAQRNGLPWLDDRTICDPGTRALSTTFRYDTSHPNGVGCLRGALAQRNRLAPFISLAVLKANRLVAVNANPQLAGGATPTSWTASPNNAGTPTRAASTGVEGGWQTTFTAAAANGYDGLTLTASLASLGLAVGDQVQMIVSGRIVSSTLGVQPRAYLTFTGSSTYSQARANSRASGDANPIWSSDASLNTFTMATPVLPIPPSTTALVPLATLEADNGGVVTAIFTSIQIVKVA